MTASKFNSAKENRAMSIERKENKLQGHKRTLAWEKQQVQSSCDLWFLRPLTYVSFLALL